MQKDIEKAFEEMCKNINFMFGKGTTKGWKVETWSPGDGWIRYRIKKTGNPRWWGFVQLHRNHRDFLTAMTFVINVLQTIDYDRREQETDREIFWEKLADRIFGKEV